MSNKFKMIIMGIIVIVVGIIMLGINVTAVGDFLTDQAAHLASFTGLESVIGLVPLLDLLIVVVAGGFISVMGIRGREGNYSILAILAGQLSLFIFIILLPIACDVLYPLIAAGAAYTGFPEIVAISPLLILIGGMGATGLLSFAGATGHTSRRSSRRRRR